MNCRILVVLMAIGMIGVAFAGLATPVKADDVYINNQTRINLDSSNYPGGVPTDWYYPGDTITGWLEGRPIGGLAPPADGLEDILDVVVWADDPLTPGCDAFTLAQTVLQANNVVLDPMAGVGVFSFPGTSTRFLSDGPYCAFVAPEDYIEGSAPAPYANRNFAFEVHEYYIKAATDRDGYIPGNTVSVYYLVSRIEDGSPMTMTGYASNWVAQSTDGLTYAYGILTQSTGKFSFAISNNGGLYPAVMYSVDIWFNSTGGGATRMAENGLSVGVGSLSCNINTPSPGSYFSPGDIMEIEVAVDVSVQSWGTYDYPGAGVLIKILNGTTPTSPEITAYTKSSTSDGAGMVRYAFILDSTAFFDGLTYTISANATSILQYASDLTQFIVRKSLETMSVRLTLDKDSYYSGETAVVSVSAVVPSGHSQPSTYVYIVQDSSGVIYAVTSTGTSTYNFLTPPNYEGTLNFYVDVYNVDGDYGADSHSTQVSFGIMIVNVNPFYFNANDVITANFELKSTVMTGSTTLFYYTINDGSIYVKVGNIDTGGSLSGSLQYTVPNSPAQGYLFTVYASGSGHVVSGSNYAERAEGFTLSISLDKQSYLPGETMAVSYSLTSSDPSIPLPRVCLFAYALLGSSTAVLLTSETSGIFSYTIPSNANEGTVIFEVYETYTSTMALEIVQIGTSSGPEVPSAPRNLQATPGNGQVALIWKAPASNGGHPITAYRIYRGTTPGGESFLTETGNVLNYTDSTLTNGQTYYYVLCARNIAGLGDNSTEVMATPATVPSQPSSLQATAGYHLVTLTWAAPTSNGGSAITGYRVYRGMSTGGETLLANVGDTSSYIDSGLSADQTYYYKVVAVNSAGEGAMSSEASAAPTAPTSEGGGGGNAPSDLVSLVLLILGIVFLVIAAALMFVNGRKMKQLTGEKREKEGQ